MIPVAEVLKHHIVYELEKEIIDILIESGLYLELELRERLKLLHFIVASYFKDASRQVAARPPNSHRSDFSTPR